MSIRTFLCLSAAVAFAAGATWVSASDSHSVDVSLGSPMSVKGKLLSPGDYRFSWSGSADKVDVTIEQGRSVVAKVAARLEQRPDEALNQEVITRTPKTGSRVLEELRPAGKKTALVFSGS
jgi:hypothetical protein